MTLTISTADPRTTSTLDIASGPPPPYKLTIDPDFQEIPATLVRGVNAGENGSFAWVPGQDLPRRDAKLAHFIGRCHARKLATVVTLTTRGRTWLVTIAGRTYDDRRVNVFTLRAFHGTRLADAQAYCHVVALAVLAQNPRVEVHLDGWKPGWRP